MENERIAVLEERFIKLAEEVGIVKRRQDVFQEWIHDHEKRELTMHNEVMNTMTSIGANIELMKADTERRDKESNSVSAKRKDSFDRALRIALAIVVLAGFAGTVYNFIGKSYADNQPKSATVKQIEER